MDKFRKTLRLLLALTVSACMLYVSAPHLSQVNAAVSASATMDGEITGTVGKALEGTQEVLVTLQNAFFKDDAAGFTAALQPSVLKNFFTNIPDGLSVAFVDYAKTGTELTGAVLRVSGTPTKQTNEQIQITIPKELIQAGTSENLTVAQNPKSIWKIDAALVPSAAVKDVTISGTTGKALEVQHVTIQLTNAVFADKTTFAEPLAVEKLKEFFTNIPAGLSIDPASVSLSKTTAENDTVTLEIAGTPSEVKSTAITITIPKSLIVTGTADLNVMANPNAKWAIVAAPESTPVITAPPAGPENNPVVTAPPVEPQAAVSEIPNTGTNSQLAVWAVLFLISICAAGTILFKLRRE
jgi:hypothetical protein